MKIEFTVKKETQTAHRFCKYIIRWLRNDICKLYNKPSLQMRLMLLESADWITWKGKSKKINPSEFVNHASECLSYTVRNNHFIIYVDENKLLPGTYTPIYKLMRFIDYGNENIQGVMLFSSIFYKYQKSIYDYWFAYKILSQQK